LAAATGGSSEKLPVLSTRRSFLLLPDLELEELEELEEELRTRGLASNVNFEANC
jgi:hypothetical protein